MRRAIAIPIMAAVLSFLAQVSQNSQAPAAQTPPPKVSIQPLSVEQQEAFLNSLVTKQKDGKMWALVHPYIVATQTVDTDHGVHCSTSSSAMTPQAGPAAGEVWYGGSSTVCRDLVSHGNATVLAFHDPAKPNGAYVVFLSCSQKMTDTSKAVVVGSAGLAAPFAHHTTCVMQEPGQYGSMTIEEGKHGSFDVWVGTVEKLGAKPKASRFDVVEVKYSLLLDKSEE